MKLLERTWIELQEEVSIVATQMGRWWSRMSQDEQYMLLGVVCAGALLMVVRGKKKKTVRTSHYDENSIMPLAQQFTFAAVILVIFTLGIDAALEGIT